MLQHCFVIRQLVIHDRHQDGVERRRGQFRIGREAFDHLDITEIVLLDPFPKPFKRLLADILGVHPTGGSDQPKASMISGIFQVTLAFGLRGLFAFRGLLRRLSLGHR